MSPPPPKSPPKSPPPESPTPPPPQSPELQSPLLSWSPKSRPPRSRPPSPAPSGLIPPPPQPRRPQPPPRPRPPRGPPPAPPPPPPPPPRGPAVAAPVAAVPGLLRPLADVALRDLQGVLRQPVGVPCLVQGGRRVLPGHALGGVEMPLRLGQPGAGLRADGAAAGADEVGGRGGRGPRGEQGLSEQFGRPAGLCLGVPRDRQRLLQREVALLQLPQRR